MRASEVTFIVPGTLKYLAISSHEFSFQIFVILERARVEVTIHEHEFSYTDDVTIHKSALFIAVAPYNATATIHFSIAHVAPSHLATSIN